MNKRYYNKQKANYIYSKLSFSGIDKVYLPLVVDIMLRRQFEFDLSDELLDRDIATFKKNVKKIEDKPKLLTEDSSPDEVSQESWDLSNCGIDKKQFMMEHAQKMEEHFNIPQVESTIEQPMQEQGFTIHSGHKDGFTR